MTRLRLLNVIPNPAARRFFDSAGYPGTRDVMGGLPTFDSLTPSAWVFYDKLLLGHIQALTGQVGPQCKACGNSFNNDMVHSWECRHVIQCSGIQTTRHTAACRAIVGILKEANKYLITTECSEIILPHSHTPTNRTDITVFGPRGSRDLSRTDLDIHIRSCTTPSNLNKPIQGLLDEGHRHKLMHYLHAHVAAGVQPDIQPMVFTNTGVIDKRANAYLYEIVDAMSEGWRVGHILNSLCVQKWRIRIANTQLASLYQAHCSTLPVQVLGTICGQLINEKHTAYKVDRYGSLPDLIDNEEIRTTNNGRTMRYINFTRGGARPSSRTHSAR